MPYKRWQQGATIAISPSTPRGVRCALKDRDVRRQVGQKVQPVRGCTPKRPHQGTRRNRTALGEEEHEGLDLFFKTNCEPIPESHPLGAWADSQMLHCLRQNGQCPESAVKRRSADGMRHQTSRKNGSAVTPTARRRDEAENDASRVRVTRPRRDGCLPTVGRTVTTTILLVYQQLPQQPCRSLKRRHDAFQCLRSGVLGTPSLVRSPLPLYRNREVDGSLTTSEAGRAGFWSGGAAPRSRDVLFVPSAIAR